MSAIELTAAQIARVHADRDEVYDKIAASTITVGQVVYLTTAGKAAPADASVTTTAQVRGIALNNAAAGQVVSILRRGAIAGFTISALTYEDRVYLSDTTGALDTAAGTVAVTVGRVEGGSDSGISKYLYIDVNVLAQYT
jgi:hypothetical protein